MGPRPADCKRLGIRSFVRWSEHLEDTTDAMLDLSASFNDRTLKDERSWSEDVVQGTKAFLLENAKTGSKIELEMHAHLSIAFAAGFCLPSKAGVDSCFMQNARQRWTSWSDVASTTPLWKTQLDETEIKEKSLAVAVSVTHNVAAEVEKFLSGSDDESYARAFIEPTTGLGATAIKDGAHAWAMAQELVAYLKELKVKYNPPDIHLFGAVPAGLMFFIGQLAGALGEIVLYEYDFGAASPTYKAAVRLPSMLLATAVTQGG